MQMTLEQFIDVANISQIIHIISRDSGNIIYRGTAYDIRDNAGILLDCPVLQVSANDYSKLYVIIGDLFLKRN